ncbi:MAG TPA: glutamine-hydrolyzing carbamoyl-phosphate synthase small subunit [Chloroflexota bacterium]|nr:glutamine-hydrolyzing carbamoyl-phosphate synthase small subunit [Chloroflexota bacterium]
MTIQSALALEDGTVYRGRAFGAPVDAEAEVVFNTCMTGYQEIATDPSYRGQMVTMTYPLIGNYGVSVDDRESRQPWIAALIVREYYDDPSNWKSEMSLGDYLRGAGIPGLSGIDTRALTRRLRSGGTMRAALVHDSFGLVDEILRQRALQVARLSDQDLVAATSIDQTYRWLEASSTHSPRIAVIDCGIKENILRSLGRLGVEVNVLPFDATATDVLALQPSGVVVSNGPGDPIRMDAAVATVQGLLETGLPFLGICLGHQILGLAIGGTTSRLRFGHHGGNHPVLHTRSGQVHITSQNHEFQVDADSIPAASGFYVSETNLNDRSVEGLAHETKPYFSVQYHPEGSPGPQDNQYVFDRFVGLCVGQR